jgi:ankyrin repeat protein
MLEVVRFLLKEAGADANQATEHGCFALYAAAQQEYTAVCTYLVKECGADVNRAMPDGETPLFIAAQFGHEAVV